MGFSNKPQKEIRMAVGSFIEETQNKVEVIQLNEETSSFERKAIFDHEYPPTKIMWVPDTSGTQKDILATSGEYLRIW